MRRLGDLEAAVMARLWAHEEAVSVRQVLDELNQERRLAYTTVMTVLDNLHRKGLVTRKQSGRAYFYVPVRTREQHTADLIADVLEASPDRTAPLLHFVQTLSVDEVGRLRAALDAATRPTRTRRSSGAGRGLDASPSPSPGRGRRRNDTAPGGTAR